MLDAVQLAGYLRRIRFDVATDATPAALAAVAAAHARSIAFENIDAFLGRRVSLDPEVVYAKLVQSGRGGWCFEQNLLLGAALRAIGFDVTDLAGRVLWGRGVDAVTPRTHRALLVRTAGRRWLADVGFGGQSLSGALDLDARDVQQVGNDRFRLEPLAGSDLLLSVHIRDQWLPMYRFDLQPQLAVDFEAANFQLCVDPASHFTKSLVLSLAAVDGRHALRDRDLVFHQAGGASTRTELQAAEVPGVLGEVFGLQLDPATEQALRARLG